MKTSLSHLLLPVALLALLVTGLVLGAGEIHPESATLPAAEALPAGEAAPELDPGPTAVQVREAVGRSLPYLEEHGVAWMKKHGCVSCHQVPSMLWSYNEAAAAGLPVDRAKLDEWNRWSIEKSREAGVSNADGIAQMILGRPRDLDSAALGEYQALADLVARAQGADGSWEAGGQLPLQRRPEDESHRVSTVWSLLALASLENGGEALERGRRHIESCLVESGRSHEWQLVRLLYEHRFGDPETVRELLSQVVDEQNEDGGWAWIRGEPSDAFATGQTLFALERTGWPMNDATVAEARRFLLETQNDDGSWTVRSTLKREDHPVPTSDYWGTGWAAVGLLQGLGKEGADGEPSPAPAS